MTETALAEERAEESTSGARRRRREEIAVFVRFPLTVIQALDRLVAVERRERGSSNRSDVIRALIMEADRQRERNVVNYGH